MRLKRLALVFSLALLAASCGDDLPQLADPTIDDTAPSQPEATDDPAAPTESEPPPETEPPTTEAPTEAEPSTTEAPSDAGPAEPAAQATEDIAANGESGGGSNGAGLLVILGLLLVVIVATAGYLVSRNSGRRARPTDTGPEPLMGSLRWLHDQLTLELLSMPPEQAATRWERERPRVDGMAIHCQQRAATTGEVVWEELAGAVSSVARSLDTAVASRVRPEVSPAVAREAIDVVQLRRHRLADLLGHVEVYR